METSTISMGKSTISTGPFSSSQTVSHYQRITISYRLSYYIPWFPNDFPWHTVSHNQWLQRLFMAGEFCWMPWWPMAWPLLKTSSGFGRFADDQVIDQNRPDLSESGYYLVITWLFHLFPSDVYRKIFGLLTVNQSASNFRLWRRRFDQLSA